MNIVALMGRLTRDPDIRYTQGENAMAIARFTLAVDKNFKKKDDKANFINCVAFGRIAETVEKHVFKGSKIAVIGEWTTGSYKIETETQSTLTIATYLSWNFATVKIQVAVQSHSQNPMMALCQFLMVLTRNYHLTKSRLITGQSITAVLERKNNGLYK